MKTSHRLDLAIQKLYTAFHSNALHPECCKQCAVGNILDNTDAWKHLSDNHGSLQLNYVGLVHQNFGRTFNGYSPSELLQIEATFLRGCGYSLPLGHNGTKPKNPRSKVVFFEGLSATVALLCALDGIDNIMDYSNLFESINDQPRNQLDDVRS
ncbi:Na(+)-translocating NADH-quinone reductase subunit F [Gelidibacter salicanalis]|uniref:Na(+)-translocating NADH-quinone reductase subunit F n=1 Tax=Gelidibacter salicanalis TaxID=291193 RepID=A0A934KTD3_9FLAO|nr:Na(+)-translocating NADH-quinone reductase subunit F [Gelidibacter salicanalis]MBJ7879115.1 Na(+)-translocating NADH-quinone reductase subunit F [Gelidibacter salicanalis]